MVPNTTTRVAGLAATVCWLLLAASSCRGREAPAAEPPQPVTAPERYQVPPVDARVAAIGDISKLSTMLRRAFEIGTDFEPMDTPREGDWLAEHPEPGQTFDEYVVALPNEPDAQRNTLYFLPVGGFDPAVSPDLGQLMAYARAFFGLEVRLLPPIEVDQLGVNSRIGRYRKIRQLLATDVLDALKTRLPEDAYCLIAITMEDLYPEPSWNFVFGMASLRERVGVYSFVRFDPSFRGGTREAGWRGLMLQRSVALMAHEVGHMFGIRHCVFFQCVMNGSNSLEESERRPPHLCPMCLRKLHHVTKLDPVARYQRLAAWYQEAGLTDEVKWLRQRLRHIQGQ